MKKNVFNFLIIGISLIMLVMLVLKTQGPGTFLQQIARVNPIWIIVSVLFMFLYWGFEAMSLHAIFHFHKVSKKISESFYVTMVGQFFNSITPFATGGQPAQVLYLMKNGVEAGNASSIVMIKFFVFQSVLTVYSFGVIVFFFSFFQPKVPLLITMTALGLAVHASMIILTILFSYNRTLTEKIVKLALKILKKVRIVKGEEVAEKKLEDSLASFHDNAALLKNNLGLLFKTTILMFIQLTFFFSIPYCIYRSFGFTGANFFTVFAASVFVATVMSIVPLPGATGGAEGGFFLFFGFFFDSYSIVPAILLWRVITFYSCIGVGGIFTVVLPKRTEKKAT